MTKLIINLVIWTTLMLGTPAFAVKMTGLYQAEIPVPTQTEDARGEAMRAGLLQVLVKVSGNPDIASNPVIKDSLNRAEYYVQEFSYSAPTTNSIMYTINIRYDADDINKLLRKAGSAVWGQKRPLILVWVAVKNNQNTTEIVSNDSQANIHSSFKAQGKKLGLPVIFPVMDIADMNLVTPDDIMEMNLSVLKEAGKRYASDAILVGDMEQEQDRWQSQWHLVMNGNQWDWTIVDKSPESIFSTLLNQVSQTFMSELSN